MQIGFAGLLAILFIALKLTGYIAWSWLWVLSPLWIAVTIWLTVVAALLLYAVHSDRKERKARKARKVAA